jgi:ABC-type transport system substrate-binding protein
VDWWNFIFQPDLAEWPATYTFDSVLGLPEYVAGDAGVDRIEGFNALDDKTLEITLNRSEGWFPLRLAWQYSAPARVEQYADLDFSGAPTPRDRWGIMSEVWMGENCQNLIITGPFACEHMEPEPTAIYQWVRNPNWWRDEEPVVTRVEGTTIRDFQTMLLMFENNEVDAALNLSGPPAVLLRQSQPEVFRQRPAYSYWAMYLDTEQEPLDDLALRQALLSSIEWDRVAEVAWEGEMAPTNAGSPLPPTMPCYDPDFQPYAFDPDRARQLLSESSYGPTGADVPRIRILTAGSDPSRIRAAQIIQEMWRVNLGIEDVEIKNEESEFVEGTGLVGIHVSSGGAPGPVPALLLRGAAHSGGVASERWTHHVDPELDAKIDELLAMDPEDAAYCGEVQEALQMVTDAAVVIPTAYINSWYQVQPWTQGFEYGLSGVYLPEVWLAER